MVYKVCRVYNWKLKAKVSADEHHAEERAAARSMKTDAKFKCPENGCNSKLSFAEYFAGCCEASETKTVSDWS